MTRIQISHAGPLLQPRGKLFFVHVFLVQIAFLQSAQSLAFAFSWSFVSGVVDSGTDFASWTGTRRTPGSAGVTTGATGALRRLALALTAADGSAAAGLKEKRANSAPQSDPATIALSTQRIVAFGFCRYSRFISSNSNKSEMNGLRSVFWL